MDARVSALKAPSGLPQQRSPPAIAMAADLTRSTESKRHNRRADNESLHRTTEAATDAGRCGAPWSHADVCVFARRRAAATAGAVDPGAARGLRAGCDAALQPIRPRRAARYRLHDALPPLPQRRLPQGVRQPERQTRLSLSPRIACCD